ncbi:MAG: hypothetical protein HY096_07725 [Nitrospinae bacterium]|nr:hypothetical protein [Nitrospinota bacterium]
MRNITRLIFAGSIALLIFISIGAIFTSNIGFLQIILLGIAFFIALIAYLMLNPPMIKEYRFKHEATTPPSDFIVENDFLLVVSNMDTEKSKTFSKNNWGFFWVNILEKEVGCFSIMDISKFNKNILKDKKVIIFPKGTTKFLNDETSPELVSGLKEFCEMGGIISIEMPDTSLSELTGIILSAKSEPARNIDWIEPTLSKGLANYIFSMPLNTNIYSVESKISDVKTIIKMDGKDAILQRDIKKGKIVMFCFDISLQLLSLKQGIPTSDDYKVKIGLNSKIRGVQTSDLSINSKMKRNLIPFADIFERFIMDIILQGHNIPVWWYYPDAFKGASIISFDEDFYGDRLADIDAVRNNIKFSQFITPESNISDRTIEKLVNNGDEIGIHWNRFYFHINKFGLHYCRNKTLESQINFIKTISKDIKPRLSCRIHYLRWGNDYTAAFEAMNNANIYLDSSYGPGRDEWGYVFGTGFPFRPLDKDGVPFDLYEFPFHCHEPYGNMDDILFDKLTNESVNAFNTTIVYLFHPYHCKKDGVSYERMLKAMDEMNGKRWVTNFREYMSFYEARKKSSIKTTRLDNKIYIEADVKQDGIGISLRHFQKIKDIQPSALSLQPSVKTGLLILQKGKHRIEIII